MAWTWDAVDPRVVSNTLLHHTLRLDLTAKA